MKRTSTKLGVIILLFLQLSVNAQQKRIYISNDDHTDYMFTADSATYQAAFLTMLDSWLDINDATATNLPEFQSKWNCDGWFWVKTYQKYRTPAQFGRLITQIRQGKITVPYSPLVITYGAVPTEAVLRSMYYAGQLERDSALDFDMATAMENQTMPLGLASLWKGSGAKYCWHGVCDCTSPVTGLTNRQKEIYWYKGLDTNRILLKWYSLKAMGQNQSLGGYAEARDSRPTIADLTSKTNTAPYPYDIAAGFGVGWDDLLTTTDQLVNAAMDSSTASRKVIVSNEVDFFRDFENAYGASLPDVTQTFGNDWEHACASIAEVSSRIKRSLEKLRAAEAMAAIVVNYEPTFAGTLDNLKKEAYEALSLYWEHSLGFELAVNFANRYVFQTRLENTFSSYVDQLYTLAQSNLGNLITNGSGNPRFYAFNPLSWVRTDYADYAYSGTGPIKIMDVSTNAEVPFQFITKGAVQFIRVEAKDVPSVGYKVFEIQSGTGTTFTNAGITSGNVVENQYFRVAYTNQGVLTSIFDKVHSKELVIITNGKYVNDLGTGTDNTGTSSVEFNGPVSITILTTATTSSVIPHTTKITLFKNIPRIEIDNQITQGFDADKIWSYSFNIAAPEVWHEETGAVIKAKLTTNGGHYATQNARYDWNTINHFASVNDTVTNYGISLSNQDCYFMKTGNSSLVSLDETINSRQLNILAGGRIDTWGIPNQGGDNTFNQRFAITTHTSYSAANEMKKALEHQNAMVCGTVVSPISFLLPNEFSFIKNTEPNTLIWAVKPAEEGVIRGIVTRVWNLGNNDISLTPNLEYGLPIAQAKNATHVETDMNDAAFSGRNLFTSQGHNEMKTYRVTLNVISLPVKILTFDGEKINESNELKWKTANEINLKEYDLERSKDGQHFIRIATITAQPGEEGTYNYSDKNISTVTPYYYRLKMINRGNTFNYSKTILIKASKDAYNIIIFPNPVTDVLNVNFILDKKIRCSITIINSAGVVVKTVAPPLFERGNNYYSLSLKELPAGEYIFSLTAGDKKYIKGFIKK